MLFTCKDFNELYISALTYVQEQYQFYHAPRGQYEYEILGFSAELLNPQFRYCLNSARRQNIVYNYAEALWYFSGKNDLEFIQYYEPAMALYSADGKILPGTGYGPKMRAFGQQKFDQIERVIEVMKHDDQNTKRAVLQLFDANEDIFQRNIDVSCTIALQFFLREGRLHMISYMRANDAYGSFMGDVFSFTFLQEYLAVRLGVKLGSYIHMAGSFHIYLEDKNKADELIENPSLCLLTEYVPPNMPEGTTPQDIEDILSVESLIRKDASFGEKDIDSRISNHYWKEIALLFYAYRQVKNNLPVSDCLLRNLHPVHRLLFSNCWLDNNQTQIPS